MITHIFWALVNVLNKGFKTINDPIALTKIIRCNKETRKFTIPSPQMYR